MKVIEKKCKTVLREATASNEKILKCSIIQTDIDIIIEVKTEKYLFQRRIENTNVFLTKIAPNQTFVVSTATEFELFRKTNATVNKNLQVLNLNSTIYQEVNLKSFFSKHKLKQIVIIDEFETHLIEDISDIHHIETTNSNIEPVFTKSNVEII
jgi:hypothetical protein